MTKARPMHRLAALIGVILAVPLTASATPPDRLVVVELFTSQGCSSCPPADALLTELARRPDVLPLAFHVTYWNGLGWWDPYSLEAATARQRAYQRQLGTDTIYTPQMVVNGQAQAIGSDRAAVTAAIAQTTPATLPVTLSLTRTDPGLQIQIGAGAQEAAVLLIGFDSLHQTAVARGENAGRQLQESNIVRSVETLATWTGQPLTLGYRLPPADRAAVLLQAPDGQILATALLALPK